MKDKMWKFFLEERRIDKEMVKVIEKLRDRKIWSRSLIGIIEGERKINYKELFLKIMIIF